MRLLLLGNVCLGLAMVTLAVQVVLQFAPRSDSHSVTRLGLLVSFFILATVVLRYLGRRSAR